MNCNLSLSFYILCYHNFCLFCFIRKLSVLKVKIFKSFACLLHKYLFRMRNKIGLRNLRPDLELRFLVNHVIFFRLRPFSLSLLIRLEAEAEKRADRMENRNRESWDSKDKIKSETDFKPQGRNCSITIVSMHIRHFLC